MQEKDIEEQLRIVREKLKVETDEKKRRHLLEEEKRLLKLLHGKLSFLALRLLLLSAVSSYH